MTEVLVGSLDKMLSGVKRKQKLNGDKRSLQKTHITDLLSHLYT